MKRIYLIALYNERAEHHYALADKFFQEARAAMSRKHKPEYRPCIKT